MRFKAQYPSSTLITFYQERTCLTFLNSISRDESIGPAILLLQSDDPDIDQLISRLEEIRSIKYIYLCSKYAASIPYHTIIEKKFSTENRLFIQLTSDHLYNSYTEALELQANGGNPKGVAAHLREGKEFLQLLERKRPKNDV